VSSTAGTALLVGLLLSMPSSSPTWLVVARALVVSTVGLAAFALTERWPARLPASMPRWALQLIAVVTAMPFGALLAYWMSVPGDLQFDTNEARRNGFLMLVFAGVLVGPWVALGAMVQQREAFTRSQALAFELERSELARKALDARMRLLQAQVQPHFLFNTLANVQALVDAGSPQASRVLGSLIAYLRAAVPRLDGDDGTLGQELQLVRAYLDLMHMRMPDRLQYAIDADAATLELRCPPTTLLTLVENAVRHGIDPSERGGRIDVATRLRDGACEVRVADSGVGLQRPGDGLGTGLATLRERLRLVFGEAATVRLVAGQPHGVVVTLDFPSVPAGR
jgi:hypothetical protein